MDKKRIIRIVDLAFFLLIMLFTVLIFQDKTVSGKIDSFFLPEERNKGYYEILNNREKCYIGGEIPENEEDTKNALYYKYDICKGSLDGETVKKDDWDVFTKSILYQMQADRAVIDLQDGTGIEISKKDFPEAVYGRLDPDDMVTEGVKIKITDYEEVMTAVKLTPDSFRNKN